MFPVITRATSATPSPVSSSSAASSNRRRSTVGRRDSLRSDGVSPNNTATAWASVFSKRLSTRHGPSAGSDTSATPCVGLVWVRSGRRPSRSGRSVTHTTSSQSSSRTRERAASTSSVSFAGGVTSSSRIPGTSQQTSG